MPSQPIKVLLIDDDEDDYLITRDLLLEVPTTRYELTWISNCDDGLQAMEQCGHDVCLLDYRLGERNGVELLRDATQHGCRAPIIMLTSQGDHSVDLTAMKAGASDYLIKGQINPTVLERAIRYSIERKKSEQALHDINSELESFAYSVSHDLRAPLRAMQGFSQLLLEDHSHLLDATGQDYLRRIVSASERLDIMIQDLLDYSRLSRKDIKIHAVPLNGVLSDVLAQLEAIIQERNANVTVKGPLPEVMGNRATLVQAIANLVSNGIKFVEPTIRPEVRVWSETFPESVRLWVEDNGIGIHPKHHDRIFRIFERLHGDNTYPGTGIGLAIVKKGVDRMDGKVSLESVPGQGSRFYLDLPNVKKHEPVEANRLDG